MTAPTQQPIQRRAAHVRLDELPDHGQQVIQGQLQLRAQVDHQLFLHHVECGLQPVHCVTSVLHGIALAPLADGVAADVELRRQLIVAAGGLLDRFADRWRGHGVLVQGNHHVVSLGLRAQYKKAQSLMLGIAAAPFIW